MRPYWHYVCSTLLVVIHLIVGWDNPTITGQEPLSPRSRKRELPGVQSNNQILLPNGWSLNPAGKHVATGDFPVNMAISADGNYVAVLHAGWGPHEVRTYHIPTQKQIASVRFDQVFTGLTFFDDGHKLAVSGGEDEALYVLNFDNGQLSDLKTIKLGERKDKFVLSGLAASDQENVLFVCGLMANQLLRLDTTNADKKTSVQFPEESFPYACHVDSNGKRVFVSLWGAASVAVVDLETFRVANFWNVRSHPTEMVYHAATDRLMIACADDNSVVVLDGKSGATIEVLKTSLHPNSPNGTTTSSLALSKDGKALIVANSDNNNLACFDISDIKQSKSLGFIPVGWYPTCVRLHPESQAILVTNGKGLTSRSNRHGPNPLARQPETVREYIAGLLEGTLAVIPAPTPDDMVRYTKQAFACCPLESSTTSADSKPAPSAIPLPENTGKSPIKHCVYIIKENRTYDQVFGDLPQGNGDPSLCIFPERVTPNHHKLAREFVLLDNFYVNGEVSADGHEWTMAAYATDFVEKTWPLSYRGGRNKIGYPSEGRYKIAQPSSGYFWDSCAKKDVSYFSFGEFISNGPTPDDPCLPSVAALEGHFDPWFRSYDLDYPDVKRAERFLKRWKQFEDEGNLPGFMVVRLPNDHTSGTRVGKPTPTAMVAENDLALGILIDGLSKTKSWGSTAVFVVEDDAQNGADHVDAHRTVALVISPYTKRGFVDSTLYSTASMLRTMGLILGLDPMTQYDAAATPMYNSFQATSTMATFDHVPANVNVNELNQPNAFGAVISEHLNLAKEDAADDLIFGDIVWRSVKGADHPMPAPVRAAFFFASATDDDDDEEDHEDDDDDDHDDDDSSNDSVDLHRAVKEKE